MKDITKVFKAARASLPKPLDLELELKYDFDKTAETARNTANYAANHVDAFEKLDKAYNELRALALDVQKAREQQDDFINELMDILAITADNTNLFYTTDDSETAAEISSWCRKNLKKPFSEHWLTSDIVVYVITDANEQALFKLRWLG